MHRFVVPIALLMIAFAAAPAEAGRAGLKHSAARLLSCDTEERTAAFRGRMTAWGKATTLEMRLSLRSRAQAEAQWAHGAPPEGFDTWLSADPGVVKYIVDKTVTELVGGASYRVVIRFRWRNADGQVVARAIRRTRRCHVPDERPNLVVAQINQQAGSTGSTRTYLVRVANDGVGAAGLFSVGLQVDGAQLSQQATSEPLAEADWTVFEFDGPACHTGQSAVATVDTGSTVDESSETDNVLTLPCPLARRGRA